MGHGTISYREAVRIQWAKWGRAVLISLEVALYLVFFADCAILIAGMGRHPDYYPAGGISLIPILLLIAFVHERRQPYF